MMKSYLNFLLRFSLIVFFSFLFCYLAVSLAYPRIYSPLEHGGTFRNISGDRWITNSSEIELRNLSARGNYLDLHFSDWHPENLSAPNLEVSVCDDLKSSFLIKTGGVFQVYLSDSCHDKKISFYSPQAFREALQEAFQEPSGRELIHQLKHIKLSSKLGFPLVSWQSVVPLFLLVFFLVLAIDYYFRKLAYAALALLMLAIVTYKFYFVDFIVLSNFLKTLYFLILGSVILKLTSKLAERSEEIKISNFLFLAITLAITFIAFLIRLHGIDFGLPFNYHPDEIPKYNAVLRMREYGDLNPRYFLHPTLLLYSSYFFNNLIRFFTDSSLPWMDTLLFSGRIMSTTAGVCSVVLLALIGRKLKSNSVGLISAALLAFTPLHITVSRYVKEDALLLFFILLASYIAILAVKSKKPWLLVLAGLVCGFSAGVKYTGLISIVIVWTSLILDKDNLRNNLKYAVWGSFAAPIGLLLSSPYIVLDFQTFLKDFNYEREHMLGGHGSKITAWGQLWTYHAMRSLPRATTDYLTYAALFSVGYLLAKRSRLGVFLGTIILLYYIPAEIVTAKPAPQPERYIVPVLPFLFLILALTLEDLRKKSSNIFFYLIIIIIPFFLIFNNLNRSLDLAKEIKPDTRTQMKFWMMENLAKDDRILVDKKYYNPQFNNDYFRLSYLDGNKLLEELHLDNLTKRNQDYLLLSSLHFDRYFSQPAMPVQSRIIINNLFEHLELVKKLKPQHGSYGFHNPSLYLFKLQ